MKEGGSARRKAVEEAIKSMGGKLEAFYFAFGESDAFIVIDAPDNVGVVASSLAVNASGAARTKTIVLLTAEEVDQAV
ncbi:MAG: GYD domain-containing protein, partial [Chloroflexota bacterium]|nr:GYD domain-containing protein [Chloroflexota bacterium]